MSTYIGVRTHASEVRAAHKSRIAATNAARLAAAGLAFVLTIGSSGGAHAAEGAPKKQSDPNDAAVQAAEMVRVCHLEDGRYITVAPEAAERGHGDGHYDPTGEACAAEEPGAGAPSIEDSGGGQQGTEDQDAGEQGGDESAGSGEQGGSEDQDAEDQDAGEPDAGEQDAGEPGSGESGTQDQGADEKAGDEQGADEEEPVVLAPLPDQDTRVEEQPAKPSKPGKPTKPAQTDGSGDHRGEVLGAEAESSGKDPGTSRGKADKGAEGDPAGREARSAEKPGLRDEILPAASGVANRPPALVLPQTGAAPTMAMQAGAGLALLLGGLLTLAGRRRRDDC